MIADEHYTPSMEQIDAVLGSLPTLEQEDFVPSEVEAPPGQFPYHVFVYHNGAGSYYAARGFRRVLKV